MNSWGTRSRLSRYPSLVGIAAGVTLFLVALAALMVIGIWGAW